MKRLVLLITVLCSSIAIAAQDIPEHVAYTQIYDFIDELAADGIIEVNSAAKPYSRNFIAAKLQQAIQQRDRLTRRQQRDAVFYCNNYALERDTIPTGILNYTNHKTFALTLLPPAFHYSDKHFKARITPILGIMLTGNTNGLVIERRWGANLEMDIVKHLSVWGSLRDISFNGKHLRSSHGLNVSDARLSRPNYLNDLPGCQYKEAKYGGDYSDARYGIRAYTWWGSVGIAKDNVIWGDNYNGSNILSGRAPSFPIITMHLTPVRWFELNYMHAWLVSNIIDSTSYYIEETYTDSTSKRHYRLKNKFMAATMMTFTPIPRLNISIGYSIIYAENNIQLAYFTPIAFYKSIDHTLTKGVATENQNSQLFFNISSRNIKHLHLYTSIYADEINFKRLKKSNPQHNPISYKVGACLSNWPIPNLSLQAEFTRTNSANYIHSINAIAYTSNSYILGHYLGPNAQDIYVAISYKPIRGLYLKLSYTNDTKYNIYQYVRSNITEIIAQKPFNEKTWHNDIVAFKAVYEPFNNCYATLNMAWNNASGYDLSSGTAIVGEIRGTAQQNNNRFSPRFYQGQNFTIAAGFAFGF